MVARTRGMADFTYHGDDQKRRDSEKAGLIAPGDIGYFDRDGFLYLCDRAKDMIISGGVNIYPAEIEAELLKMPGIADCAVFGIPDEEFGEGVYAVVQPSDGAEITEAAVKAYLREHIAGYKMPRRIDLAADLAARGLGEDLQAQASRPVLAGPRAQDLAQARADLARSRASAAARSHLRPAVSGEDPVPDHRGWRAASPRARWRACRPSATNSPSP